MKTTLLFLSIAFAVLGALALGLSWTADLVNAVIVMAGLGTGMLGAAGACLAGYLVVGALDDRKV
ncbi:hypothetical protein [Frigoribacterium sp. PhB118]|uniref:hypothetical protein n=1 Tax=Frigoribacterium sp. PhB118 TaxID=2485175 RepID=UPI000F46BFDD|nr:hypothetical protein [Frigoribacterium sp. PhB118]ROS57193.1 hypothetical protein EDF21_0848 [Frigoribacterium sp. PhB118]